MKESIEQAVKVLKEGGVILYPTDTVWGLGCLATDEAAVSRIFSIKRRPEAKSLVLLAPDLDMVARFIRTIPSIEIDLVEVNDAPMTIVYPGAMGLPSSVVAEDGSVGIRIPLGGFCLELARRLRVPLVSTSANISGEPAAVRLQDVPQEIVDAVDWCAPARFGRDATGRPSQIIKLGLDGEVEIIRP